MGLIITDTHDTRTTRAELDRHAQLAAQRIRAQFDALLSLERDERQLAELERNTTLPSTGERLCTLNSFI